MNVSPKEIMDFVSENDVKFIRLTFCDMQGNLKNIAIMPSELPRALSKGILVDAASFSNCYQDLLLVPDISTLSVLPWRPKSGRVVRFFCNLRNLDGSRYAGGMRGMLQEYIQQLAEKEYFCELGTKSEFYLFDCDDEGKPTKIPHDHAGYLDVAPLDKCENARREICLSLEEMGMRPQKSCHKYGPGQNEIDFKCSEPVTAADNMVHYKTVVKTIAAQNGLYASFMPKPLNGTYGSALTIIISVRHKGKNIFEQENHKLPEEGAAFVAGILEHMPEMTVFLNPITNSYTRLRHRGAPNQIHWSMENRLPMIRIHDTDGEPARIDIRSTDCTCNPYLTFRLLLAAGIDGIQKKKFLSDSLCLNGEEKTFSSLPANLRCAYELAKNHPFIQQNLPEEIRSNFWKNVERQLALYDAAEDKALFEEQQYFLSE